MPRLSKLNQKQILSKSQHDKLLKVWQFELLTLQQCALRAGMRAIVNFEGMDAAGKGGSIRRLVEPMDPRGYKVYRVGAPEKWEQERHYLYRFWTKVPPPGELAIFDRSWYGRVLVERVEKLVPEKYLAPRLRRDQRIRAHAGRRRRGAAQVLVPHRP